MIMKRLYESIMDVDSNIDNFDQNSAVLLKGLFLPSKEDISITMSKYGGNEQVGSLGRSYTKNDKQMTTENGDIVLYGGDRLVVFYGANSWSYTLLGKIDLPEEEVTELLSKEDVKRITGWSSRRVSQTFDSPELKDKVIYIGKKMQIEESDFRRYLQSGTKKDSSTYWLKQIK